MRLLSVLFAVLSALISVPASAQENWPIVPNCIGDLRFPIVRQGNWDFPGVIISSHREGIHGIRADRDIEYFIALESGDSFPNAGTISPDGIYFAYPIGYTDYDVNSAQDDVLSVDHIQIVRTDGLLDETYRFEARDYTYTSVGSSFGLSSPVWFSPNEVFHWGQGSLVIYDMSTDTVREWDDADELPPHDLKFVSPDGTRAFGETLYDIEQNESLSYLLPYQVSWFADSSGFAALTKDGIAVLDRDGEIMHQIDMPNIITIAAAPDQSAVAFWDIDQKLFIADFEQQIIHDTCFTGKLSGDALNERGYYPNLAWSPDSASLAFIYDGYLVIVDTHTFDNQVIDHLSNQVIAWVPLEGEIYESSDESIRVPLPTPTPTVEPTPTLIPTEAPPTPMPAWVRGAKCTSTMAITGNVRNGAGISNIRVGTLPAGTRVTLDTFVGSGEDRWWRIEPGKWVNETLLELGEGCELVPAQYYFQMEDTPYQPEVPFCIVTATSTVNLRTAPNTTAELVGGLGHSTSAFAIGQAIDPADSMRWWQLNDGAWVRSDFVTAGANCDALPTVSPTP